MLIKTARGDISNTPILITLNTAFFFFKQAIYLFFMLTTIAVRLYLCNLSINEASYFQQALYNKAKVKDEIKINKT